MSERLGTSGEWIVRGLNACGALVAAAYAARGVAVSIRAERSPARWGIGAPGTASFWAASSAVRTFAVVAPLVISLTRSRPSPHLLVIAALVQLGDAAIGVTQRNRGMTVAPVVAAAIHVVTALRSRRAAIATPR